MSVPLYLDHHVHGRITEGLRRRGVDVLTTEEDGTKELEDELLPARALSLGRLLFTQDQDLLSITDGWLQSGRPFAGLAYAHRYRICIGEAIDSLELIAKAETPEGVANQVFFLPF